MKKIILFSLLVFIPSLASAYDALIDGIYYNLNFETKEAEVAKHRYVGSIVIPSSVFYNEYDFTVASIGPSAFDNCSYLTSVTIPNSVTEIGSSAFSGCTGLTSVTIGNSVTGIGEEAFSECLGLTSVTIPNSVNSISSGTFRDCTSLTSVTIPNSVTKIGKFAFFKCTGLTSVTIPNSVTEIGEYAFSGCTGLTSVTIPNSVTEIGSSAFSGCTGLTSVSIGNSVTEIGEYAFSGCTGLNSVSIGNSVNEIGNSAFRFCTRLASVTIPNSVTGIGESAFSGCTGLTSVTIGKSVTIIGDYCFSECTGLTSIKVESGNTTYDSRNNCNAIIKTATNKLIKGCNTTIIPNGVTGIGPSAFYGCTGLTSVTIPNSVTGIGGGAFSGCTGLTSVTIPNSVTGIGDRAFYNCDKLTSIYSAIEDVFSINDDVFASSNNNVYENAILYVPLGTIEQYKRRGGWNSFNNIYINGSFYVVSSSLCRETNRLHINLKFSQNPYKYTQIADLFTLGSKDESVKLLSFSSSEISYDLYYELPRKSGIYTFEIKNTFMDTNGKYLNSNLNDILNEEADAYKEDFSFNDGELYIIAQSPITGVRNNTDYIDIVFNSESVDIPNTSITILSPSGKNIEIKSIEFLRNTTPTRHRIYFEPLEEDGIFFIKIQKGLFDYRNSANMLYDYESSLELPRADLQLKNVFPTIPQWTSGQKQSINYTIRNVGTDSASGQMVNVLYLSSKKVWDSDAIEIIRDTANVVIDSGKDLTRTIDLTVPVSIDGQYYLIMKTNVSRTINETTYDNNSSTSDFINLSVDWLTETNNSFSLKRGESRMFRVLVESDKNVEVIDRYGNVNMFVGCGEYPYIGANAMNGSITLLGSSYLPQAYYLLVSNNEKNQLNNQPCELKTREFEIEIASIGRTDIVKHKTAWIPIEMMGCSEMPEFYLIDGLGTKVECLNVYAKTETSFYAQFDTEKLQTGKYSLYVECDGKTGMMHNAINITMETPAPSIDAKLILPETSRIGSTITAYIDYKNVGNVDVPTPLFVVTGTEGSKFSVDDNDYFSEEGHIYGMNEQGVLSALLPGESNRISIQIQIPNQQISTADYILKTSTTGCDGIEDKFYLQWLDVDPNINPGCYTDEEWTAYCNRLRNNVGDTWLSFIQSLATITDLYFNAYFVTHDATRLYDILKGYDLAEILSNLAVEKAKRKNVSAKQQFDEPGTIYLYDPNNSTGGTWVQLVEWNEEDGWKQTADCPKDLNNRTDFVFISHGMNNTHNADWIKKLADELYYSAKRNNIICVDWGKWAYAGGPLPQVSGYLVNPVVDRVYDAINVAFNKDKNKPVDMGKFYLIGHSHGAHVCGRLANKYSSKTERITALDASEELAHPKGSQMDKRWNAKYIDYYKSSSTCGTEYLPGDDNFILVSGDGKFNNTGINIPEDISRHGYAYEWFNQTIQKNKKIGYYWYEFRSNNFKVTEHKGWTGVINGPKMVIEDYSNYSDKQQLNYTSPWYNDTKKNKPSEWAFFDAFATTVDYNLTKIDLKNIEAGTKESLKVTVSNNADNLSVSLEDRESKTRVKTCHVLYVTRSVNAKPGYRLPETNGEIAFLHTDFPLYYLDESDKYVTTNDDIQFPYVTFDFNISYSLWKKLGGNDEMEYLDCDFWVVSGVDKTSSTYKDGSVYSVQFWKGELRPHDNVLHEILRVYNPKISCDAGKDQVHRLGKDKKTVFVSVLGTVENGEGRNLHYAWNSGNQVFSSSRSGGIYLGVGKHTLSFEVEDATDYKAKGRQAPKSFNDTVYDDVSITVLPYIPGDEDDESTETASSWDPNEKVGIRGAGGKSCIRQGETMEYTIYFENDAEKAQLAAQTVTVIDTLDTAFDLTTFEFTGAEASNTYIDVPLGKSETTILTDMRPDNDLILKTEMKLDIDKRIVKVVYSSLDTLTYEPTLDVFAGFLPPNDFTHRGEGHFSYRVRLKEDVADGYVVKNQAHIFFDYNDEIATNITHHPVDNRAPISTVDGLPNETREDSIMVSWSGYDQGAGIRYYDIYRSKNGGNFELWKSHTKDSYAYQYGVKNDIYKYFSIATDSLGFVEEMKTSPEATVKFIGSSDGITLVENDPKVDVIYQNEAFIVTGAEESMFNVYDLLGQIVVSKQLTSHYERIPFDRKGVYLVSVDNRVGVLFEKKLVTK